MVTTRFFKGLSAIGIDPSQNWTFFYVHFLKAKKTFEKKKVVFLRDTEKPRNSIMFFFSVSIMVCIFGSFAQNWTHNSAGNYLENKPLYIDELCLLLVFVTGLLTILVNITFFEKNSLCSLGWIILFEFIT